MKEINIMRLVQIRASEIGWRLMRNNNAKGWMGKDRVVSHDHMVFVTKGTVIIENPRRLHAGLGNDTGDLVGWKPTVITPDMVGQTIAVFANVEVKAKRGRATPGQLNFNKLVNDVGGFATIVRDPDELS